MDDSVRAEIVETIRRFVASEVIPVAAELERTDAYPEEIVAQMRAMGLFGITIPEAYGGLGLDLLTYIAVIEELAYGWMSLTGIVNTHTMAATLLMTHGDEEQKKRWLPDMASGERRGALSLSEPDAGSDTRQIRCSRHSRPARSTSSTAPRHGSPTASGRRSSRSAARSEEGISAFIVEKEPGPAFEGISVSKTVGKLGYKGVETVEMAYADHRIPAANLIRSEADGCAHLPPGKDGSEIGSKIKTRQAQVGAVGEARRVERGCRMSVAHVCLERPAVDFSARVTHSRVRHFRGATAMMQRRRLSLTEVHWRHDRGRTPD